MSNNEVKKITMFEYKGELFKSKDELNNFQNKEISSEIESLFEKTINKSSKAEELVISSRNLEEIINKYNIKNIKSVLELLNK